MWAVEFTSRSRKQFAALPKATRARIMAFLEDRAAKRDNPRLLAKRLVGVADEVWRFRVGDFRILARFEDDRMIILVVEVGDRREVYR